MKGVKIRNYCWKGRGRNANKGGGEMKENLRDNILDRSRASLQYEKFSKNIDSFRVFIEKFSLFFEPK